MLTFEHDNKEYELEYDLDNRLSKADVDGEDVEYRYDAFGRRIIRKEGSTKTALLWWGNSECAEQCRGIGGILDVGVAVARRVKTRVESFHQYKHQAGQAAIQNDIFSHPNRLNAVIARAVDGSKFDIEWYHKNYLDHVYAVSKDNGNILEHYRYNSYGEVEVFNAGGSKIASTAINNQITWNTRRQDSLTGFHMYKFRHYASALGRWVSRDPIQEAGGVNLYGFVGNDSVNYWDRLGLKKKVCCCGKAMKKFNPKTHCCINGKKVKGKKGIIYILVGHCNGLDNKLTKAIKKGS